MKIDEKNKTIISRLFFKNLQRIEVWLDNKIIIKQKIKDQKILDAKTYMGLRDCSIFQKIGRTPHKR